MGIAQPGVLLVADAVTLCSEASVYALCPGCLRASSRDRALELLLTHCVSPGFSQDSLAAEIEGTMRKELQLEEPESPDIAYGLGSQLPGTVGWASDASSDHCDPSADSLN